MQLGKYFNSRHLRDPWVWDFNAAYSWHKRCEKARTVPGSVSTLITVCSQVQWCKLYKTVLQTALKTPNKAFILKSCAVHCSQPNVHARICKHAVARRKTFCAGVWFQYIECSEQTCFCRSEPKQMFTYGNAKLGRCSMKDSRFVLSVRTTTLYVTQQMLQVYVA